MMLAGIILMFMAAVSHSLILGMLAAGLMIIGLWDH